VAICHLIFSSPGHIDPSKRRSLPQLKARRRCEGTSPCWAQSTWTVGFDEDELSAILPERPEIEILRADPGIHSLCGWSAADFALARRFSAGRRLKPWKSSVWRNGWAAKAVRRARLF